MWGKRIRKCRFFFLECVWAYDYQYKASRYRKGLSYLTNTATTNQKHTIASQKPKRREHKHNTKENHQTTKGNHQTTKGKTKRKRKGQRRNIKSMEKQG